MKTFLLLVVFILVGLAGYLYFNPEMAHDWLGRESSSPTEESTRVYKWRDNQGNWQITDRQPPAGVTFETLDYHRDVNVLPLPPALQPKD